MYVIYLEMLLSYGTGKRGNWLEGETPIYSIDLMMYLMNNENQKSKLFS